MSDMRALLEREGERVSLPSDAADRMFERGRRRERNRRLRALGIGALLVVAVLVIVRSSLPNGHRSEPARPRPITARSIAGTYAVRLRASDKQVDRLGLVGPFSMQLKPDGSLHIIGPHKIAFPWNPATFEISRGVLTTDAFVGTSDPHHPHQGCQAPATYRVERGAGSLTFTPVEERCRFRAAILATRSWTAMSNSPSGRFQGEWTATFSCERMVRTVQRAAIAPRDEASWYRHSGELGSDPNHPCTGAPDPITFTYRFDRGRLLIYGPDGSEGFDGGYEVRGNVMTIRDARTRNINGSYQLRFRLNNDRVSFQLLGRGATDPFFVATWESAPFLKNA
jgi:predicted nucleic acid-binding Zn ribbon protein